MAIQVNKAYMSSLYWNGYSYSFYIDCYWDEGWGPSCKLQYKNWDGNWVDDPDVSRGPYDDWESDYRCHRRMWCTGYAAGTTVSIRCPIYSGLNDGSISTYIYCDTFTTPAVTTNYTVSYNLNGGTGTTPSSQTAASGTAVVLATRPNANKTGYHSDGWSTSTSGSMTNGFGTSYTVTGNRTFYLHWLVNTYTVAYNGNGATSGSTASSSHTYGVAKALTSNGFSKTGYTFIGWATSAGGSVQYTNGQSVTNLTTENGVTITLYAVWEDTTEKASYIIEHVQGKAYTLRDPGAPHGSGVAGRVAKWSTGGGGNGIDQNWVIDSGNPPSSVSNGAIYVKNNQPSSYPNWSSWQAGNQVNISPELAYAAIKVVFKSETATTYTVEVHTSAYGGGYTGGFNDGNYDWSLKISLNGGSTYTQIAGATNTWCHFGGSGGWLRSDSPGIYNNTAYVINKTASTQSVKFQVSNYFHGYGTSTKTLDAFTVPAKGMGPAVGDGSWKHSVVWVKDNTTWKQAIMWMNVNGTWTKAWY